MGTIAGLQISKERLEWVSVWGASKRVGSKNMSNGFGWLCYYYRGRGLSSHEKWNCTVYQPLYLSFRRQTGTQMYPTLTSETLVWIPTIRWDWYRRRRRRCTRRTQSGFNKPLSLSTLSPDSLPYWTHRQCVWFRLQLLTLIATYMHIVESLHLDTPCRNRCYWFRLSSSHVDM